jgi:hypothetical protein
MLYRLCFERYGQMIRPVAQRSDDDPGCQQPTPPAWGKGEREAFQCYLQRLRTQSGAQRICADDDDSRDTSDQHHVSEDAEVVVAAADREERPTEHEQQEQEQEEEVAAEEVAAEEEEQQQQQQQHQQQQHQQQQQHAEKGQGQSQGRPTEIKAARPAHHVAAAAAITHVEHAKPAAEPEPGAAPSRPSRAIRTAEQVAMLTSHIASAKTKMAVLEEQEILEEEETALLAGIRQQIRSLQARIDAINAVDAMPEPQPEPGQTASE